MEWLWIIGFTTVLLFCLFICYRLSFIKGYRVGASMVLNEWKKTMNEEGQGNDGQTKES